MKKGRRYVEPMTGRGDKDIKKRDVKKIKREAGKLGMAYHVPQPMITVKTG